MEHPSRNRAAVVGAGSDVVDRLDLAGEGRGGAVGDRLGRRGALEHGLRGRSANRGRRHRAEREVDVAPGASAAPSARQASAITTLLIAWARRVPTLRIAELATVGQRDADPQQELVVGSSAVRR